MNHGGRILRAVVTNVSNSLSRTYVRAQSVSDRTERPWPWADSRRLA